MRQEGAMASMDPFMIPAAPVRRTPSVLGTRGARLALAALGWLCLVLGVVTLVVPLLPTTIFLLIALWALSQSSAPGYRWLREHPTLGPTMREWDDYGVISQRAKIFAITGMVGSEGMVGFFADENWLVAVIVGIVLVPVAVYIATRPSNHADQATL
jgi:uncharacterized membrane protein YbaN (DUF454 family)